MVAKWDKGGIDCRVFDRGLLEERGVVAAVVESQKMTDATRTQPGESSIQFEDHFGVV